MSMSKASGGLGFRDFFGFCTSGKAMLKFVKSTELIGSQSFQGEILC